MAERSADSIGPTNETGENGTWGTAENAAPQHKDTELVVSKGNHIDDPANPGLNGFTSARHNEPVRMPYPEARYWNASRIGSRGFASGAVVQPTILFDGLGFAIMADNGASFIAVAA